MFKELHGCTFVTPMSERWSLFLGTCGTCCRVHRIDDIEASKFTNLASIRVSMGTSQTACDGEDVCSKAKSLMMMCVWTTHISHSDLESIRPGVFALAAKRNTIEKRRTFKQIIVILFFLVSSVVLVLFFWFYSSRYFSFSSPAWIKQLAFALTVCWERNCVLICCMYSCSGWDSHTHKKNYFMAHLVTTFCRHFLVLYLCVITLTLNTLKSCIVD